MKKEDLICCQIDCKNIPEYNIQNVENGAKYDDYLHSCKEHLSELVDMFDIVEVTKLK